jgi:transposase
MQGSAVSRSEVQISGSGHLEMADPAVRVMSAKEIDRARVLRLVLERRLTRVQAGESLGLSSRQVARLCGAFRREGAAGLISRKRGRVGNRKLPSDVEAQVVDLTRRFYQDLGPTLVRQRLVEQHGIKLAKETIRKILSRAGLWLPKTNVSRNTKPSIAAT